ncbi:hypothetical protein QVD17_03803 [Tagetes erecta]|uniref:Uncharacterized protein n=1 Tax=Tagetes erecta TaxID=13708 RepID=A0AAD8PA92_TARER|nr:hypothetical protein QVD17_03803 [Tagetes erecta]
MQRTLTVAANPVNVEQCFYCKAHENHELKPCKMKLEYMLSALISGDSAGEEVVDFYRAHKVRISRTCSFRCRR